jgi:hypothetical protein
VGSKLAFKFLPDIFGGPGRIRTGDRQVSRGFGYEPAALSGFSVLFGKEVT